MLKNKPKITYNKSRSRYIVSYFLENEKTKEKTRIRKSFVTEDKAKEFAEELEYKSNSNIFLDNNSIPLNKLMRFIVERKKKMGSVSDQQYGKTLRLIEAIEKSEVGTKDISEITPEDLQNYFDTLTHYRNSYIQKHLIQFTQAFTYAQNKGYIKINPMTDTYKPKSTKPTKVIRAMELEEQEKLTNYLKSKTIEEEPYKNAFLIQLYAGLRIGEVMALQTNDIDLENNLIKVTKTLTRNADGKIIMGSKTKTFAGIREIPIPDIIKDELKEQIEISKNNFDGQLFVSKVGKYADPRNANAILKRILINEFKINDITTHSLRHTFGTRCIESGMAPVVVQRLMGHKDISVTLNTYTSILNKFKEDELQKLKDYYDNNITLNSSTKEKER